MINCSHVIARGFMVTSGGGGDGCFAGASSYGSSGPHLAWSRPGPWLSWLLLPLPSRFPRLSQTSASLLSHRTRTSGWLHC